MGVRELAHPFVSGFFCFFQGLVVLPVSVEVEAVAVFVDFGDPDASTAGFWDVVSDPVSFADR